MKVFCLVVLVCGLGLAQTSGDNNSADSNMKKRVNALKLMPLGRPWPLRLEPGAAKLAVCSVPLLAFVPKGNFPMPVVKPVATGEPSISVPAPACESDR